ncbi:YabP/YqfC family sporulation protein [Desulfothermobacter acidiphilus]|uniref:YabP/YqfC family sporulation protein n=1 Tax=Desulfothermobacter acidiphilus TaxID=1938353 RepID=UPI003F8C0A48
MDSGKRHSITLEERKRLVAEGVRHVGTFSDTEIRADTWMGQLCLRGEDLKIAELNLETGRLVVEGKLIGLAYGEGEASGAPRKDWRRLWDRLWR